MGQVEEILGHTTLDMVSQYLHFTSAQIAAQHHKFSPMDKLHGEGLKPRVRASVSQRPCFFSEDIKNIGWLAMVSRRGIEPRTC